MATYIHPSSIVSSKAKIGSDVVIGPYVIIGDNVVLEDKVVINSHSVLDGDVVIGEGSEIYSFVTIGLKGQDLKYNGEKTKVRIGKNNVFREGVTLHTATLEGKNQTTLVGDNCLFMVNSHIAHDCQIGSNVIIANNVLLAGHVEIGDFVTIGGGSAIHQFCRIGEYSFLGGMSGVTQDIVPYILYTGVREEGIINGVNLVGLRRKGFTNDEIHLINNVYGYLFDDKNGSLEERILTIKQKHQDDSKIKKIIDFIDQGNNKKNLNVSYKKH